MEKKKNLTIEETFNFAVKNHQEDKTDIALELYKQVLKINPNHETALNNLGVLFKKLGQIQKAKRYYEKAIEINLNYLDANYNLGKIFVELKDYQKAKDCYKKTIEIKPDHLGAHHNLGIIFVGLKDYQKAKDCYEKAIKINPSFAEAHNNLGVIYIDFGEHQKAKDCFEKTIEIKPDHVDAHNNLGVIFRELNRLKEAEASFKKTIELKPDYAGAHHNLGITLKELNKLEEAEASYRKSIIFNPDFIEVIKSINIGDWENSKYLLEKMCTIKIIDMNRNVREFIRIWCMYCHNLLIQGDIKRLIKILTKLFIIGERNRYINNLIKSFFNTVDIIKALELVELNDKILIEVSYCQYKFLTKDFVLSESLAASNIKEALNLIVNPETADLGWLVVRRSLALCKNKNIAREILNSLITNLELTK